MAFLNLKLAWPKQWNLLGYSRAGRAKEKQRDRGREKWQLFNLIKWISGAPPLIGCIY